MDDAAIAKAKEYFGTIVEEQLERVEQMKKGQEWIDYSQVKPIIIGIIGGDGIGPFIAVEARSVLEFLLKEELESGKVVLRDIEGLTIYIPYCSLSSGQISRGDHVISTIMHNQTSSPSRVVIVVMLIEPIPPIQMIFS